MKNEDAKGCFGCGLMLLILLGVVGAICAGVMGLTDNYSSGHRDGVVQKFSRPTLPVPSWEGELALAGFHNHQHIDNTWSFSVESDEIAEEINSLKPGEEIRLHYKQHLLYNRLKYRSGYRVYKVERVK